ncbi:hypothetical protein ACSHWB_23195 [Lentzea sp. HUAS TT2]|uniref:hypothetical protein n=1 Tax=Lentzea sp. HUAS TT2 TaxID=3447454 RepID=UPI003F7044DA
MRIEQVTHSLPAGMFISTYGRIDVRLWALVSKVRPEDRAEATARVRQAQRIYDLTSGYLHSRRAAIVPSHSELAAWKASIAALEVLANALSDRQRPDGHPSPPEVS